MCTINCSLEEFLARVDADSEDVSKDKEQLYNYMVAGYEKFGGSTSAELTWRLGRAAFKRAAVAEVAKDKVRACLSFCDCPHD